MSAKMLVILVAAFSLRGFLVLADVTSDLAALTNLLQQQAVTIQALQARVTALENDVTSVKIMNSNLSQTVNDVKDSEVLALKKVAFSAHMAQPHVYVGDSPFIFNVVLTNVGDGYSAHDGIFTAPLKGLYVFHFVIVNDAGAPFIQVALKRSGNRTVAVGTVDGGPSDSYDDGSVLVTTELQRGESVWVQRNAGASRVYGDVFCSFSGFLL